MRKFIYILLIILFIAPLLFSEEGASNKIELSIEKAISMTLENSEEIQINEEKRKKIYNTYREIKASVFPQINAMASLDNYIESPVLNFDLGNGPVSVPLKQEWDTRYGLTLSQVLWSFGKVGNAVKIAKQAIDLEDLSMDATRNGLVFAAKQLYYTMLFAAETLRISRESYGNAQKNKQALKEKFKGGRISRINNVKMEADIAMRYTIVQQARSVYDGVEVSFKDLLGIDRESEIIFTDSYTKEFKKYSREDMRSKMIAKEPVARIMRANIELNKLFVKQKRADFFPVLAGYLNYSYAGNSEKIYDNMQTEVIAGLRLDMPIWDSGKRLNSLRKTVNDSNIAELEYKKKLSEIEVELEATLAKYARLLDTYKASVEAEKLAGEAYSIMLASFKSGVAGQTMLNDAEIQLTSARMARIQTLFNISITIAKIEKLAGNQEKP